MKKKNPTSSVVIILLFVVGLGVLLYPSASNWFNSRQMVVEVENYKGVVNKLSNEELQSEYADAKAYNDSLRGDPVEDPFLPGTGRALPRNYLDVMDFSDNGVFASVKIPSIDVNLPIYHGTSEEVLYRGVGHIEGTAIPIGGEGTHCVLTAHTGLPSAKLFTDLEKMQIDDIFIIEILNMRLAYKVDQISVIEPDELSALVTFYDEDRVTLLTCTPYGINSHRLLVQALRTDLPPEEVEEFPWVWVIVAAVAALLIIGLIIWYLRKRKKDKALLKQKEQKKLLVFKEGDHEEQSD